MLHSDEQIVKVMLNVAVQNNPHNCSNYPQYKAFYYKSPPSGVHYSSANFFIAS